MNRSESTSPKKREPKISLPDPTRATTSTSPHETLKAQDGNPGLSSIWTSRARNRPPGETTGTTSSRPPFRNPRFRVSVYTRRASKLSSASAPSCKTGGCSQAFGCRSQCSQSPGRGSGHSRVSAQSGRAIRPHRSRGSSSRRTGGGDRRATRGGFGNLARDSGEARGKSRRSRVRRVFVTLRDARRTRGVDSWQRPFSLTG
jgi:hypothetical protein